MRKVLLIEDNPGLRSALIRAFRARKFRVFEAADPEAAIALAKKELPHLVLCDLNFHETGSAADILSALRNVAETAAIPFILMTGEAIPDRLSLLGHVPDAVLEKPFTLAELSARVEELVARNKASGRGPG